MTGRPPRTLLPLAVIGLAFLALPLAGLVQRAPWGELASQLGSSGARRALWLSLACSLAATAVALAIGLPLAWLLARVPFPGRSVVRAVTALPMVLPPVVAGVGLLAAFGRRGTVGEWMGEAFGIHLPFTAPGVVVAQTFVALPFLVITTEAALRSMDRRYEEAAATLGAGRWVTLARVTLPTIAPAVVAGTVLAWARALGEFGATVTFAGNLPGRTQTLPLAVFLSLEQGDTEAALALSLVLLVASLAVLVALRDRWLPKF